MCHSYLQEQCQQRSPEDRGEMADGVFSDLSVMCGTRVHRGLGDWVVYDVVVGKLL